MSTEMPGENVMAENTEEWRALATNFVSLELNPRDTEIQKAPLPAAETLGRELCTA